MSKVPDLSLYRQTSLDLSWNPKIQTLWKYLDLNLTFTAQPSLHKISFSYLPMIIKASCRNPIIFFFFSFALVHVNHSFLFLSLKRNEFSWSCKQWKLCFTISSKKLLDQLHTFWISKETSVVSRNSKKPLLN